METLKRGQMAVEKKRLIAHCRTVHDVLNTIDELMKERESVERGRKIAQAMNKLNTSLHALEHFDLNIPLKELGDSLPAKYK